VVLGVTTNLSYLRRVLETEAVIRGEVDTGFLERAQIPKPKPPTDDVFRAAAFLFASPERSSAASSEAGFPDPFEAPFRSLA
jgi:acetyl/propionyl-CoA carboxylase alpha subunit